MRRFVSLVLLILALTAAGLFSLAANTATGDQSIQAWLRSHQWYSLQHVCIALLLIFIIWLALEALRFIIANQRERHTITLSVGSLDPKRLFNRIDKIPKPQEQSLLYILDVSKEAITIVQCPIRLVNTSSGVLRNVRLDLRYSQENWLEEKTIIPCENGHFVVCRPDINNRVPGIERHGEAVGGVARISYFIDVLRPKDPCTFYEPIRLSRRCPQSIPYTNPEQIPLETRLEAKVGFIDYLQITADVVSEESTLHVMFDIYAFKGRDENSVRGVLENIRQAIWVDHYPKPGKYFLPWGARRAHGRIEITVPRVQTQVPNRLYSEVPLQANGVGMVSYLLPKTDFRNTNDIDILGIIGTKD